MPRLQPAGGVYIGVGPAQNFHYIGRLRPTWAFIVDIRRDNLLQLLLLNAVLARSETPFQYLCELFSRACEAEEEPAGWEDLPSMVSALDEAAPDAERFRRNLDVSMRHIRQELGFVLGESERETIGSIYRSFFDEQLGLRFRSHGRRPMPHHPSYRQLLLATGPGGEPSHFLSRADDYAHVRELARGGRLVPVVGDFAGEHALRAVGRFAREQGEVVSAFYVSNVEFYLMRSGSFSRYAENVRSLPLSEDSIFIRAYFSYGYPHPAALPAHRSTLVRQRVERFLTLYDEGAYRSYWELSTLDYLP